MTGAHDMETNINDRVLVRAKAWLGTPYVHQASILGAGTDCLGLIRGIWRDIYGQEPEPIPPYTPDWAECNESETLLDAAHRWLLPKTKSQTRSGDVMVFRMMPNGPCKHVGIYVDSDHMIHAYARHAVMLTPLVPYWSRRWTHTFSFPTQDSWTAKRLTEKSALR